MVTGKLAVVGSHELWGRRETDHGIESRKVEMRLSEGAGIKVGLPWKVTGVGCQPPQKLARRPSGLSWGLRVPNNPFHLELIQGTEVRPKLRKLGRKRQKQSGTRWPLDLSTKLRDAPCCMPSMTPNLRTPTGVSVVPTLEEL